MKEQTDPCAREVRIFATYPVPKALLTMALPTVISQIIYVIYNMADTWFVGLTGDANTVAAVSLCLPVYNLMTGLSNLFGIGGASAMARALGEHDRDKTRHCCAVAIWSALAGAVAYAVLLALFQRPLLSVIGGDPSNLDYAVSYTTITMIFGAIPTILSSALAHLIRATGASGQASVGLMLGALCNMGLDPLFMFVLLPPGQELVGAAVATAIANTISLVYFVLCLRHGWHRGVYAVHPRWLKGQGRTVGEVFRSGLPSFLMVALNSVSNSFLNASIGAYGSSAALSGLGIVRKIDGLAYSVNQGITQGMLPIVAYCYTDGRWRRMRSVITLAAASTILFSLTCTLVSQLWAEPLVAFFLNEPHTVAYGAAILRILSLALPIYSGTFVIIAAFQAVGRTREPFGLCLLRRGSVDVLLQFAIRALGGGIEVVWATPITESFGLILGLVLLRRFWGTLKAQEKGPIIHPLS